MKHTAVVASVLTALALLLGISVAVAQTHAPMTIEFIEDPRLGVAGVDAYIGTTLCASIDFDETLVMQIGGADAPAGCDEAWRVVELQARFPSGPALMFTTPVLEAGAHHTIQNFGPFPIEDGPDVHSGISVETSGRSPDDLEAIGPISAYVAGTYCGGATLTGEDGADWIPVGHRDNPEVCSEYGQAITLVDGNNHRLVVSPTVGLGPFYILENLAPYPPGTAPFVPSPADAGHGVADEPSRPLAAWFALGALAVGVLGLGRRLTTARRCSDH